MAISPVLTINQLKQGVRLTHMNVRVIHKWTRPDIRDKTKTGSIEVLLLDVENEIIQATITKQLISFFGSKILVGKVYSIRNLTVNDNIGPDKATPNPCRLKFEFSSKVQEITNTSIPVHGYQFAKFEDIVNGRVSTTYFIDVVGKLYEIGPIVETRHGHKCRTIKLEDIELVTAGFYYTHAKIIDLDCTSGWYYDSCKLCWAKTIKDEKGRWKCTQTGCDGSTSGLTSRVPRFQVKFIVVDTTDEEAAFVVFDSQITQFINHTAAELLAKIEKAGDHDFIPRELEAFIDKTFVFKIEIHDKYNVCNGSNSYTVLHMSDDDGLCEKWLAKHTELFKVKLDSFKSSTKDMMVRVANVKVLSSTITS
ncbi:hypothetical protein RND81_06G057400 [Saponaria officinalis]|uniref:Replication factor A C-terminal domain-containing protein n=1 Tax=Saponaria officinalis TaxID=3572 RepID=A0AAW1K741_SAPOF